jgi:hypothetical protein
MAFFKRKTQPEDTGPPPRQVRASAVPLTGPEAIRGLGTRQTTQGWQESAWYFYDAIGEFRGPVNWIANAISKADLFGAETDPETGLVTGPTEDRAASAAAAMCLGGPGRRAQLQYILAICWQVPGEAYIIVRGRPVLDGRPQPDEWLVLSGNKVKAEATTWKYQDPDTLEWRHLGASDRMLRVWSPHPNDQNKADTAARAAIPVMREIEKASMNLAATLDSRIATNGIHALPQELDMPLTGDNTSVAEEFSDMMLRAASAGLSNPGTAAAQVPVYVTIPSELIASFVEGWVKPDTAMDNVVIDLRATDLSRLAAALDMPKEVAEGTQGASNHWSAWQVEESTYKIFIEPLLDRVGDALTEFWYRPVLRAMGVENPERHTLAWDTTGIVSRPDSTEDMNWLYINRLISDDFRRQASGIPDDAAPVEEEAQRRLLVDVVLADPSLITDPEVGQRLLGFELEPPAAPEAAPLPAAENDAAPDRALPAAPAAEDVPDGLVAAAGLVVKDALSRAGGRLLTREHRGQFGNTPKWELHTMIPVNDPDRLMEGSFQFCDDVAAAYGIEPTALLKTLEGYTRTALLAAEPHDPDVMLLKLKRIL